MKAFDNEQAVAEAMAIGLTEDEATEQAMIFADYLDEVCDKCGGELDDVTADYCNTCWGKMEKNWKKAGLKI